MLERSTALILLLLLGCGSERATPFDRALAALRGGDLPAAESATLELRKTHPARCDFLSGNIAFARCRIAEQQASTPEAEPFAWDVAINYGKAARDSWQDAAMSRPDWPAARRNVERALLKLEELERKKADAEDQRRRERDPQPKPQPKPPEIPPPPKAPEIDEDPTLKPQLTELEREQVLRLLETLAEKEREKLALRRARRRQSFKVERDW